VQTKIQHLTGNPSGRIGSTSSTTVAQAMIFVCDVAMFYTLAFEDGKTGFL
jgi:hypothetical protein